MLRLNVDLNSIGPRRIKVYESALICFVLPLSGSLGGCFMYFYVRYHLVKIWNFPITF